MPRGSYVALRGQVHTMTNAYSQLYFGLAGAIVLIYLMIVVNFQSWLDPFIIITALPGALAGIVWMLFMTGTTLSVPALTGAIMCMGIATANSILLVSFAREGLAHGLDAAAAALEAGFTRFRPVLMTALAMIIGMLPMAFALGEGGEQNAPLGRAVIGGLLVATVATLFFVPTVFSVLHRGASGRRQRRSRPPTRTGRLTGELNGRQKITKPPHDTAAAAAKSAPDRAYRRRGGDRHRGVRNSAAAQPRGRGRAMDAGAGDPDRRGDHAASRRRDAAAGAARHRPGLVRGADLCARQRLSEGLVFRLRRAREKRRRAGRDRNARSRCPARRRARPS